MANISEPTLVWGEPLGQQPTSYNLLELAVVAVLAGGFLLWLLRQFLLPRPIAAIPYLEVSASSIFGDIPAMLQHIKSTDGTFITYLRSVMERLNSPVVQVFVFPFSKPLVVIGDYAEAHDMLVHREHEFDRSATLGDIIHGILPSHHIHLPTGPQWKAQRLLVRDLLTPSMLSDVGAPAVYTATLDLLQLWRAKAKISDDRAFEAHEDIHHFTIDAMSLFTFGPGFDYSIIRPTSDAVRTLDAETLKKLRSSGTKADPVAFPHGNVPDLMWSFMALGKLATNLIGNPIPRLTWAFLLRLPSAKKAYRIKEDYVRNELSRAVEKLNKGELTKPTSALESILGREKVLAEKAGREPDYFSRIVMDEVFGILYTGHETTSTMLSWAVKYLADTPSVQNQLRETLHKQYAEALAEGRNPTAQEIMAKRLPYLEAIIEETLRCACTTPSIDRVATVDTEILGYRIPKGTAVAQPTSGPSITMPAFTIDEAARSPSSIKARREGALIPPPWNSSDISVWKPERWLLRRDDGELEFNKNAGPQVAFGLGTRGCYGQRFAYVKSRILLTLLVWNFELQMCAPSISRHTAVNTPVNTPRHCYVRLRELQPSTATQ